MPTLLTWNIYHGTYAPVNAPPAGASPMNRLTTIANFCLANNIDIICLQELPQADLDPVVAFGLPGPGANVSVTLAAIGGFNAAYTTIQCFSENNPNAPRYTNTTDGYLIMYLNATFPGGDANFGYYNAGNFNNQYGATLRPPVTVELDDGVGNILEVMNWHAQTGPGAGWSLEILDGLVGPAGVVVNPIAIGGDFNVRGDFHSVFGGANNFVGWTNIVANYPGPAGIIVGLDHVLTTAASGPIFGPQLDFTSDAYHYPIAANF